jgi:hypothetical protein
VFGNVVDPVGAEFVTSLARPGGNTTGFMAFEYSLAGKWVELLKEIPTLPAGIGQFAAIQSTAPSVGVDLSVIVSREAGEIERAITAFADEPKRRPDPDAGYNNPSSPADYCAGNPVSPAERLRVAILQPQSVLTRADEVIE